MIHAIFTDSSGDSQVKLPSDEDLEKAFEAADESGDGVVDEEEFLALLQDIKDGKVAGISHDNFFQNLGTFSGIGGLFQQGSNPEVVKNSPAEETKGTSQSPSSEDAGVDESKSLKDTKSS